MSDSSLERGLPRRRPRRAVPRAVVALSGAGALRPGLLLVASSPVLALAVLVAQAVAGGSLQVPGVYLAVVVLLVTGLALVVVGALSEAVGRSAREADRRPPVG